MAVEEQIQAVTAECTALEQELKSAEAAVTGLASQLSDTDLDAAIQQLAEDGAILAKKAEALDQPGRAPVSPGRKDLWSSQIQKYRVRTHATISQFALYTIVSYHFGRRGCKQTAWVARKRIAMDGVNQIADGMEKKPKAVLALIGLETDEDAGIKELPSM